MQILDFIGDHIYPTLLGHIFIEELGVPLPIPGDAMLVVIGVLASEGKALFWMVMLISCLATWVGASILFLLSQKIGRPWLLRHEKILRWVNIADKDISNMEHYMADYGTWVLIIARLTPGLRTIATVAAGVLGVSYRKFITATLLGTVLWTSIYFWLGFLLGRRFAEQIEALLANKLLLASVFMLGLLFWIGIFKFTLPRLQRHRH